LALVLAYTAIITPFRVAFLIDSDDSISWNIIDYVTDSIFGIDIIVNFFSAYYDSNDDLITSHK
jgi:lipid-A-disaccharide synthase-like uncharacterized protein